MAIGQRIKPSLNVIKVADLVKRGNQEHALTHRHLTVENIVKEVLMWLPLVMNFIVQVRYFFRIKLKRLICSLSYARFL